MATSCTERWRWDTRELCDKAQALLVAEGFEHRRDGPTDIIVTTDAQSKLQMAGYLRRIKQ